MSPDTRAKRDRAVHLVLDAILESIRESGREGAPASSIYMAIMQCGLSYDTYESLMDVLVQSGQVRKINHCYYAKEHIA